MNLKELSKQLGLSQTTVSRAINGYPEVSLATRNRVQDAARKFGYSPNVRAKGLATGRSLAIGHVVSVSQTHEMMNPVFGDFIAGAGDVYARHGYEMILSVVYDNTEEEVYRNHKRRGTVDGVIVHGPLIQEPRIDLLNELGLPYAVHGRSSGHSGPYTWLDVNNRSSFRRATSFLLDLGHQRLGLINGLEAMDFAARRRDGFEDAHKDHALALDPALLYSGEMTEGYGYRAASEMLSMDTPPTGFLISSMISAIGARRAIEERGLKMGRDVSIVTHDDALSYLENGSSVPIFTAVRSSVRDAGRQLAEMLIAKVSGTETQIKTALLEAQLVVGNSTGPMRPPLRKTHT
ncbi:LacI family transcriptional regulator [Amylibacter marinus]|uniref:LacI family transcriptional regulator n=1 Tax=Amylibacter marinus TaxID=1475483 RepID=A0ABQ5VS83_9RHOB|nr:substrate-binding domain-containing protein [Amylibacter marinus]GLQ33992.1 LacI family transcriptional regulator [Amylibacter marinus]